MAKKGRSISESELVKTRLLKGGFLMPRKYTDDEIEEALHKSHGLVAVAARYLSSTGKKITRQGLEKVIYASERLTKILDDENATLLDFAEQKLFELINAGDKTSIIFYLKCKGKARGYVERQEMTGANGAPLNGKLEPVDIKIKIVDPVTKTEKLIDAR